MIGPALLLLLTAGGCSIKRYAINKVGDALSQPPSTFETDGDIELVGEALPFGLKFIEGLLVQAPEHRGLLLSAAQGFVLYSYAYVDFKAFLAEENDLERARQLRDRARNLYLRAFGYGVRGLEASYPNFGESLQNNPGAAVTQVLNKREGTKDVPFLYWTAASLGLAISAGRNDATMLARLPEVEALIDRAIELDEDWDRGALHEFKIQFAAAKIGQPDYEQIRKHFERAQQLSNGENASLYVSYAEAVAVPNQDRRLFQSLLDKALAIDADKHTDDRLVTVLAQRRARWLLDRVDELILPEEPGAGSGE